MENKTNETVTKEVKKPVAKKAAAKPVATKEKPESVKPKATPKAAPKAAPKVAEPVELDPNMYVTVKNGFAGKLLYRSRKTGELFIWDGFGTEQDIELRELKSARNNSKVFFENNWFLIEDPEVISYLGVERYYKDSIGIGGFERIFESSPSEIAKAISNMPEGQRETLIGVAREKIGSGEVDSLKVIKALEDGLGVKLVNDR